MENSRKKISSKATGITTASRCVARCWFSNYPPQVMLYPVGSGNCLAIAAGVFHEANQVTPRTLVWMTT